MVIEQLSILLLRMVYFQIFLILPPNCLKHVDWRNSAPDFCLGARAKIFFFKLINNHSFPRLGIERRRVSFTPLYHRHVSAMNASYYFSFKKNIAHQTFSDLDPLSIREDHSTGDVCLNSLKWTTYRTGFRYGRSINFLIIRLILNSKYLLPTQNTIYNK